jgi:hypothetical protein
MASLRIISVSPERYAFRRTYNHAILIPACPNDRAYTQLVVEDVTDWKVFYPEYDYTKAERTPIPVSAQQICDDLFNAEDLGPKGCFVIPAEQAEPTKEQLQAARNTRRAYLQSLVQKGDAEMARTKRVDEIPDFMKRAAFELGAEREWAFAAPPPLVECEACGNESKQLRSGGFPILCRTCGYPLPGNRERAIAEGLWAPKKVATPPEEPKPDEPPPPQAKAGNSPRPQGR